MTPKEIIESVARKYNFPIDLSGCFPVDEEFLKSNSHLLWELMADMAEKHEFQRRAFDINENCHADMLFQPEKLVLSRRNGREDVVVKGSVDVILCREDGAILPLPSVKTTLDEFNGGTPLSWIDKFIEAPIEQRHFDAFVKKTSDAYLFEYDDSILPRHPDWMRMQNRTERNLYVQKSKAFDRESQFVVDSVTQQGFTKSAVRHLQGNEEGSLDLGFSRLFEPSFFIKQGVGVEDAERVSKEIYTAINSARERQIKNMLQQSFLKNHKKIKETGDVVNEAIYPINIRNFIVSAPSQKSSKYRRQFVDKVLWGVFDNDYLKSYPDGQDDNGPALIISELLTPENVSKDRDVLGSIIDAIDDGFFPRKSITEAHGLKKVSQKEFSFALEIMGTVKKQQRENVFEHKDYLMSNYVKSLGVKESLGLAKIPQEWLLMDENSKHFMLLGSSQYNMSINQSSVAREALKTLCNAGRLIGECQATGDKKGLKKLTTQWRWLSQKEPLLKKLSRFDKKHDFNVTHQDYLAILSDFVEPIIFRSVLDSGLPQANKLINYDIDTNELSIDWGRVLHLIGDDKQFNKNGLYYGLEHLSKSFHSHATSLKEMAEKNLGLHKNYNSILMKTRLSLEEELTWRTLVDAPIQLNGGYTVHPINSRTQLFEEGESMDHCAFSYLQNCLNGDSLLFSARDAANERVATVEMEVETGEDGEPCLTIVQCLGYSNKINDDVTRVERELKEWVKRVEKQEIPSRINDFQGNSVIDPGWLEKLERDPASHGGILLSLPYDLDSVLLSYFFFEEYTPEGLSIDVLFEEFPATDWLFKKATFYHDIKSIKQLAEDMGVSPLELVEHKKQFDIRDVSLLGEHYKAYQSVINRWPVIYEQNKDVLEGGRMLDLLESALTMSLGETFGDREYVLKELSVGSPDWGAIAEHAVFVKRNIKPETVPTDPELEPVALRQEWLGDGRLTPKMG